MGPGSFLVTTGQENHRQMALQYILALLYPLPLPNLHFRYKIVVEVVIGEQRGEGVRMGTRCLWDSDTDNYASDVFMNDSLFCCAAAFGIYYY